MVKIGVNNNNSKKMKIENSLMDYNNYVVVVHYNIGLKQTAANNSLNMARWIYPIIYKKNNNNKNKL